MFEKVLTFVKDHKTELLQKGIIVVGTVTGLLIAGVIANAISDSEMLAELPETEELPSQE